MKTSLKIGAAYISTLVGAGIASGQELLQYFTYYGWISYASILIATIMFAWLGYVSVKLGNEVQGRSYKEAVNLIGGKYFGIFLDLLVMASAIVFYVAMIAGGGSLLNQMFDTEVYIGRAIIALLVAITVTFNMKRVIEIIGAIVPFMLAMAIILAINTYLTSDLTFTGVTEAANRDLTSPPHLWYLSGLLYVSFSAVVPFAVLVMIGGTVKDPKVAARGGIIGGLGLGLIILLINSGLIAKLDVIEGVDMPTLLFANDIAPWLSIFMGLVIFAMIYSSGVSAFAIVVRRISSPDKAYFIPLVFGISIVSYLLSTLGFVNLVYYVYPILSYFSIPLLVVLFVRWIIGIKRNKELAKTNNN